MRAVVIALLALVAASLKRPDDCSDGRLCPAGSRCDSLAGGVLPEWTSAAPLDLYGPVRGEPFPIPPAPVSRINPAYLRARVAVRTREPPGPWRRSRPGGSNASNSLQTDGSLTRRAVAAQGFVLQPVLELRAE